MEPKPEKTTITVSRVPRRGFRAPRRVVNTNDGISTEKSKSDQGPSQTDKGSSARLHEGDKGSKRKRESSPVLAKTEETAKLTQDSNDNVYYEAVYAKASTRKHKKMEDDGYIVVSKGVNVVLKDKSGKTVGSCNYKLDSEHIEDGKIFKLGGKEVQICDKLKTNPFPTDASADADA